MQHHPDPNLNEAQTKALLILAFALKVCAYKLQLETLQFAAITK